MNIKWFLIVALISTQLFATTSIRVNQVGYEKSGPKMAIFQNDGGSQTTDSFKIINSNNSVVLTGKTSASMTVNGWKDKLFQTIDFSSLDVPGKYTIQCGDTKSPEFTINNNILFSSTASSVVDFFKSMRNTDNDHAIPFFYDSSITKDVYGGWSDATGDRGKYLSHLSYANYFNPQQIPFVVWSLLRSYELNSSQFDEITPDIKAQAAWGADYLLRVLDPKGFFYITVFDGWGSQSRQICAWEGSDGKKTVNYQAALREGGGMSIAALAKISRMGIHGDSSSSQYLSAAKRAYDHLKTKNLDYDDDGKENIIDDYCGLLAATELYLSTQNSSYFTDAENRARNLMHRLADDGWFFADNKTRPFYHGADEGLPIVALVEFLKLNSSLSDSVKNSLKKAVNWYTSSTLNTSNCFSYPQQVSIKAGAGNIALNKTATASSSESTPYKCPPSQAFDGDANTRWSSDTTDNQWIKVDLDGTFSVSKVILTWETACGKEYSIQMSTNGSDWTTVSTITDGAPGKKEISFTPVTARYVQMKGSKRATRYGYSLYEFEVYGTAVGNTEIVKRYFMPHSNETGYWWQGENARLSSIAAGLLMSNWVPGLFDESSRASIWKAAIAQLDWILGKNPFGICMMYGFGTTNYPAYDSKNGFPDYKGGICNGITAGVSDESDIAWAPYSEGLDYWQNWRWIEQWLPHDAWYLLAISQLNYSLINPYQSNGVKHGKSVSVNKVDQIRIVNNRLLFSTSHLLKPYECKPEITDMQGRQIPVRDVNIKGNTVSISVADMATGFYFVRTNLNQLWQRFSVGF